MIGVILAAGVGSRLRPITNDKPKCLVTTANKTILQYQLDAYRVAGVNEIFIVVGYEGQAIKEYCKHIKDLNIVIVENNVYEETNNMYSLYLVKTYVNDRPFVLNNADLSVDPLIVKRLLDCPADNAIAVDTSLFNDESMKISLNKDGYISDISKKISEKDSYACSIDFYKFSAESSQVFFGEITRIIEVEGNRKDWTEVAMQRLFQRGSMKFSPCDIAGMNWVEIDNYEDLALSDRKFSYFDERLREIDCFLFDLDGTIYTGDRLIAGASQTIKRLRSTGKSVYFLSNNSSKNKTTYVKRLNGIGIECSETEIVLSTDALVAFLKEEKVERVHVLGTKSLEDVLVGSRISLDSDEPEYVVIGYDTELTYQKLIDACKYINTGVDILATHVDNFCPSEVGPIPDIGALLEMIRLTTGRSPVKVFGKPSKEMIKPLLAQLSFEPSRAVIVGDRLHTDILMAKNMSCLSLLVLSGETTRDQLEKSPISPDFVLSSVGEIFK